MSWFGLTFGSVIILKTVIYGLVLQNLVYSWVGQVGHALSTFVGSINPEVESCKI